MSFSPFLSCILKRSKISVALCGVKRSPEDTWPLSSTLNDRDFWEGSHCRGIISDVHCMYLEKRMKVSWGIHKMMGAIFIKSDQTACSLIKVVSSQCNPPGSSFITDAITSHEECHTLRRVSGVNGFILWTLSSWGMRNPQGMTHQGPKGPVISWRLLWADMKGSVFHILLISQAPNHRSFCEAYCKMHCFGSRGFVCDPSIIPLISIDLLWFMGL